MHIEPSGSSALLSTSSQTEARPDSRIRSLSTTLSMAVASTSRSSAGNITGIAAIARSLSSAARDLGHAAGFVQQGQDAARNAEETLRAMQAIAQRPVSETSESDEERKLSRELDELRGTVLRLQASSFEGTPVFSAAALRTHLANTEDSLGAAPEVSVSARATLRESGSAQSTEDLDRVLTAAGTIRQEFEVAERVVLGAQRAVAQSRLDALAIETESQDNERANEIGRHLSLDLSDSFRSAERLHAPLEVDRLLALLAED